jgi:hypothetical protein
MTIGYFGRAGFTGGKTHFVEKGKPVCNTYLPKNSEFQWCIPHITFDSNGRVECRKCTEIQNKYLREKYKNLLTK